MHGRLIVLHLFQSPPSVREPGPVKPQDDVYRQPVLAGEGLQTRSPITPCLIIPHRVAPKPSLGMTIIRSAVLSFARAAPRKYPTRFSSPVSFPSALLQSVRQMATSESKKHHFMVYIPDRTDPETVQLRLSLRSEHLARVGTLVAAGVLSVYRHNASRG